MKISNNRKKTLIGDLGFVDRNRLKVPPPGGVEVGSIWLINNLQRTRTMKSSLAV